jgi:transcriptional regulator with XRE-family HTH domain
MPTTFTPCLETEALHDSIEMRVGQTIRMLRRAQHLSQNQLARRLKTTNRAHISKLERGLISVSISFLERLARAFGMEVRDLFELL